MLQIRGFLRFCVVGAIGFFVDASVLTVFLENDVSHYTARALSFPTAVLFTWWLNRIWTFSRAERSNVGRQITRYFTVQIMGFIVNFMVYLTALAFVEPTVINALFALVAGSAAGLIVNYFGAQKHVFRTR